MDTWVVAPSLRVPSAPDTPTRASRTRKSTSETTYTSFVRRSPNARDTTFSVGDTVIIGPHATTRHKFLGTPPYLHVRNAKKPYEGWRHEDGLEPKEKVGLIVALFEDTEMVARVRWFARPGAVWDKDGPQGEDVEEPVPYELYYTADSTFVRDTAARKDPSSPKHVASSGPPIIDASHAAAPKAPRCTDLVFIENITEHVKIVSKFDDKHQGSSRTFIVRQVYDVCPVPELDFIDLVNWDEVARKGKVTGVWDPAPVVPGQVVEAPSESAGGGEDTVLATRPAPRGRSLERFGLALLCVAVVLLARAFL